MGFWALDPRYRRDVFAFHRKPVPLRRRIVFAQAFRSELLGIQKETFDVDDRRPMPVDESMV